MNTDIQELIEDIFARVDREEILADLAPKRKGSYLSLICPSCGKRDAFIYDRALVIGCNRRNDCGYSASILTYLNNGTKPTGERFWELLHELAISAGIEIDFRWKSSDREKAVQKMESLEAFFWAAPLTEQEINEDPALALWFGTHGYNLPAVSNLLITAVRSQQRAQDLANIYEPGVVGWGDLLGRIIFPIQDRHGRIIGWAARAYSGQSPKYRYSPGLDIEHLGAIGLNYALPSRPDKLLLVEGIADLFALYSHGFWGAAAIGGVKMSLPRLKLLYRWGITHVILANDFDKAGRDGTLFAVNEYTEEDVPSLYIWAKGMDIGTILSKKQRPIDFVVVKDEMPAYQWKANELANMQAQVTDPPDYIRRCLHFDTSISAPSREVELEHYFWPEVQRISGKDLDFIFAIRNDVRKSELKKRKVKQIEKGLQKSVSAFKEEKHQQLLESISETYRKACEINAGTSLETVEYVSDRLTANTNLLAARSGKTSLGILQHTLPAVDKNTLGLRQFIILAGGSNVGKSVLLSQFMQDMLANNKDTCGLFLSLEMTGHELIDRMKSRVLNKRWADLQLCSTAEERKEADEALATIAERMIILEPANCSIKEISAERIISEAIRMKRETGCTRCVIGIDYLQLFPVPEKEGHYLSDLGRDDYRIDELKKVRFYQNGDPLIVVSEVNKFGGMSGKGLEKVKGSGRATYGSDGVIFLNSLSDEELVQNVHLPEIMNDNSLLLKPTYAIWPEIPKKEIPQVAKKVRERMLEKGKDFLEFSISKFRDGGKRASFLVTHFYETSQIEQGLK